MAEKQLTNEELAELLKKGAEGVKEFNEYRQSHEDHEIDFSGQDFSGMELIEANFEYPMRLENANFSNADLHKANFCAAEGRNIRFFEANCEEVCFDEVKFPDAVFVGADCTEACLRDCCLDGASFKNETCVAAMFTDASLRIANFENTNLAEACLVGTKLEDANFEDAYIETANFAKASGMSRELCLEVMKNLAVGWNEEEAEEKEEDVAYI